MSDQPNAGRQPTFDPRDRAAISEVRKRGEYYEVVGHVDGRRVSVEIAAPDIESRTAGDREALMRRGLLGTSNAERDQRRERP